MSLYVKNRGVIQGEEDSTNNTNRVNTVTSNINAASSSGVNVVGTNISIDLPPDLNMHSLEDIGIFEDSHDDEDVLVQRLTFIIWIRHSKSAIFQLQESTRIILLNKSLEICIQHLEQGECQRILRNMVWFVLLFQEQITMTSKISYLLVSYLNWNPRRLHSLSDGREECILIRKKYRKRCKFANHNDLRILTSHIKSTKLKRQIDKTLFIKRNKGDILLVQVYVDVIIFGSTKKEMYDAFEELMLEKIQMSSMGELTFFLGLQVKQKKEGIFISQDKYVTEILKKFRFLDVKKASTPMETLKPLLKDKYGEEVDTTVKIKTVNDDVRLQALIDGKKVVINEASIRYDLKLIDAEAIEQVGDLPTNVQDTPILDAPSSSQPHRKHKPIGKEIKETEVSLTKIYTEDHVPTTSNDPLPSATKETVVDKEESSKRKRKITDINVDAEVNLGNVYNLDMAHEEIVLSMQDVSDADVKEVAKEMVKVITTAKIIVDEVSTAGGELNATNEEPVSAAPTNITTSQPSEATQTTVKDKGKAKLVKEPKIQKSRKSQIATDEEVVRRIEAEWNADVKDNINWNEVVEQEGPKMDAERIIAPIKRTRNKKVEKDQTAKKQKGDELEQDNTGKQKLEEQQEAEELKKNLEIVPDDEDDVFMNVTPLCAKPPTIMDYKIYKE
nr:putative ribonuclease H-like domain-containing protein [Tanacetum cinerariifolium]